MNALMAKLEAIEAETAEGGPRNNGKAKGPALDEFTRLKKEVHKELKACREAIKERDELLVKNAGSKQTVEMSARIRAQIKTVREEAQQMAKIQRSEANKKRGKNMEQVEHRAEVVELVFAHIEEVEALEKQRFASKDTEARASLFAPSGSSCSGAGTSSRDAMSGVAMVAIDMGSSSGGAGPSGASHPAMESALPDIDVQEGLQQLKATDQRIDQDLEEIEVGVSDLRTLAIDMKEEVRLQSAMVDEITHKVGACPSPSA